jgi:hypothetical protein
VRNNPLTYINFIYINLYLRTFIFTYIHRTIIYMLHVGFLLFHSCSVTWVYYTFFLKKISVLLITALFLLLKLLIACVEELRNSAIILITRKQKKAKKRGVCILAQLACPHCILPILAYQYTVSRQALLFDCPLLLWLELNVLLQALNFITDRHIIVGLC